jgi:hypothetical protein
MSFGCQVGRELVGIPTAVWGGNVVIPVVLYEVLKIFAVRGSGVRDAMVREPAFELGLVPFVVRCAMSV